MNRMVVLEAQERVPDSAGGYAVTWRALGMHWADVRSGAGREKAEHLLPRTHVPLKIIVRAQPVGSDARPVAGQRFVEGTRRYNIDAVRDDDRNPGHLICHAQEEVAT